MKNGNAAFRTLEQSVIDTDQTIRSKGLTGYVSMAVYAPSTNDPDAVFALFHTSKTEFDARRADQYIYRRLLDPASSIAAEAAAHGKPMARLSRMFPDEHFCMHWPIGQGVNKGLLQLVFNKSVQPSLAAMSPLLGLQTPQGTVENNYNGLVQGVGNLDAEFNARAAYAPNGIVLACDISHFTDTSSTLGQFRAQDFINDFCAEFITDIAKKHGGKVIGYEGDGAWFVFPIDNQNTIQQAQIRAMAAARDISGGFSSFARQTEPGFDDAHVRTAIELGEIDIQQFTPGATVRTGPIFTYTAEALKQADRDNNVVLVGPDLAKEMNLGGSAASPLAFKPLAP